jgi:threonine dehydrogenase-like Zn-dependent dehydrogenase
VLVLRATDEPVAGVAMPSPNQRYRFPSLGIEERALGPLEADMVRVRMVYVGVCGSDTHLIAADPSTGYVLSSVPALIPEHGRVLGHEGVGVVAEVSSPSLTVAPGDVVAFASLVNCGECEACRRGLPNQCRSAALLGTERDGLFGDLVDVPAQLMRRVTDLARDDRDLRALACLEPAAVAALACSSAPVNPGDSVLVFGAGPIGAYCAMVARQLRDAGRVVVVEPAEVRRDIVAPWSDEVLGVEEFFGGDGAPVDVVLEASGALSNVSRVMPRVGPGGRIVLLGRSGEPLVLDSVDHMISEAVSIRGCRGHLGGAIDDVLAAFATGSLPIGAIVTHVLDSLEEARDLLADPESIARGHGKVLARLSRI